MEFEFDKEIDAILRKSSRSDGVVSSQHLDADIIAAFADNALPARSRSVYTMHLADCDKCRKTLSQVISFSDAPAVRAIAAPVAAVGAQEQVPWYAAIFRTPGMAVAMGGLILVFSGVLGYLVLQNIGDGDNAIITQISEPEARQSGPFAGDQMPSETANSNAAISPPANSATAANMAPEQADQFDVKPTGTMGSASGWELRKSGAPESAAGEDDRNTSEREVASLPKPGIVRQPLMSVAPPPPPPASEPLAGQAAPREEAKKDAETERAELSDASLDAKKKSASNARTRDLPPAAAKGPARSGPVQMQSNQVHNNAGEMSVTRTVGSKKFANRDGAWYDTSYRGQVTTNVRRGTDEFKKLDSGLRTIANQIDGVIVVVWRSRAYRIQ